MASRESYKISNYWKHPRGGYNRRYRSTVNVNIIDRILSVYFLFKRILKSKYERQLFLLDNVIVPFNKLIGCKITKHNWFYMDDEQEAFCTKCHIRSGHIPIEQWNRMEKLKSIKKRIKK